MIYLDNAASSPLHPEARMLMESIAEKYYGNPSSIHRAGREARVAIEDARRSIATNTGVAPSSIYFTSGGTEAINTILTSCVIDLNIRRIITSQHEHPAVLRCLERLNGIFPELQIRYITHTDDFQPNLNHLEQVLSETGTPALVVLMHANNETGNLLPIKNTTQICRSKGALFFTDMVQSMGKFHINLKELDVDFACCSSHKFHGPKGAGFFYVKQGIRIKPMIYGGGQERNMRAGTENTAAIAGMAKALEISLYKLEDKISYIHTLKKYLAEEIAKIAPDAIFRGTSAGSGIHTILNVGFPAGDKTSALIYRLDMNNIIVSGGSACSSGLLKTANSKNETLTIRFSFSQYNTMEEIEATVVRIKKILE